MKKLFAVYLSICAIAACAAVKGGVAKCPTDAVCAWVQFGSERIYTCAAPADLEALKIQAARLSEVKP